jgi:hypothetical protein
MKDKSEPRSVTVVTVVIVPKAFPGADKFTAIRAQLRFLGVPPHQVPVSYPELLQMMENARNYPSYSQAMMMENARNYPSYSQAIMNNIECYVVDDVFSRSYLIRQRR